MESRTCPRLAWLAFALAALAPPVAWAQSAPAARTDAEPAPPKGMDRLLRKDCATLEQDEREHIAAGRFDKPDGNNATIVIGALDLKNCAFKLDAATANTLQAGVTVTNEYIAEGKRYGEYCPVFEIADFVPGKGSDIRKLDSFRGAYCSPAPPSTWTEEDTRIVQQRVLSLPWLDELHKHFEAAWTAQRFYDPPGDNVLELALEGRDRGFGQIKDWYVKQLQDLMPYAVKTAEQRLAVGNRAEFERLFGLIARADPQLPDLERLRRAADGKPPP